MCAPELPVPRVVRARDGAQVVTVEIGGRQSLLQMLTWLPGANGVPTLRPEPRNCCGRSARLQAGSSGRCRTSTTRQQLKPMSGTFSSPATSARSLLHRSLPTMQRGQTRAQRAPMV